MGLNQAVRQQINTVINNNIGSKLTPELAMGLSITVLSLVEKALIDVAAEATLGASASAALGEQENGN